MQFLGFGSGANGDLLVSSNTTDSPVDSSCSGTTGTTSLTATNASFSAGDIILIHQSRGTGVGAWELNQIASYVAGTITTAFNLANTYTDSGASQAQVLVVKQYSQITIDSGKTLTAKAWDGNVGGILAYMCSGNVVITGTISANGLAGANSSSAQANGGGYRGGQGGDTTQGVQGDQGEGTSGAGGVSTSANGSGGGGGTGSLTPPAQNGGGGGGGGHSADGATGSTSDQGGGGGTGGGTSGSADLTTMTFGGGGGGGGNGNNAVGYNGGNGGGIIFMFAADTTVTGSVAANGGNGCNGSGSGGSGGGGGGGSILIKAQTAVLGTTLVTATKGTGGTTTATGGDGSAGRVRVEACSVTGSTSPSASKAEGGHDFCGAVAQILGG